MATKLVSALQLMLMVCLMVTAGISSPEDGTQDVSKLHENGSVDYDSEELTSDLTTLERPLINQRGCSLPDLDLFSQDVMKYYHGQEPDLVCGSRVTNMTGEPRSPLFTEDTRFLYFNSSALVAYGSKQVVCSYSSFERVDGADDNVRYSCPKPLRTDEPNEIADEFVEVICNDTDTSQLVYKDYFAFLPLKKATEDRCEHAADEPSLNTLIVGLDTLSRLQFHRHFPQSAKFMKGNLEAVELFGYHKVAENTFPNLATLLSGLSADQLDLACLREHKQLVDTCPLIWKKYHEKGFRTIFVEDAPKVAIFNYGARGFQHQPTDYYVRPMYLQYEANVGHNDIGCGYRCLGSRSSLAFLLNHAEKTARVFRDKKYFGFHWSCSATHNTFNIPAEVDDTVHKFLKTLQHDNLLNNTLFVLMADHGPRILSTTTFINTRQGFYEKRLPLMLLVFPEWFKKKYTAAMTNLRRNSRMLTTHYDLHRTLHDLTNLNSLENDNLLRRYQEDRKTEHAQGRSLFLPISTNRTCYQARIPSEFCACPDYITVTPSEYPNTRPESCPAV